MTERIQGAIRAGAQRVHEAIEHQKAEVKRARTELAPRARLSQSVQSLASRPSERALGAGMDELLRKMQGPYQLEGRTVKVPAGFRSLHDVSPKEQQAFVRAIKKRLGDDKFQPIARHVLGATSTRGTPEDVRATTQALLDAGAADEVLAKYPGQPERATRLVMSAYGIGLDCRGYVMRSFLQARGTGSQPAKAGAYFLTRRWQRALSKRQPTAARFFRSRSGAYRRHHPLEAG